MKQSINTLDSPSTVVAGVSPCERQDHELSVVMPCLNEAATVGKCVAEARRAVDDHFIDAEVIVADNGSRDRSTEIAEAAGARVIHAARKGYGSALVAGIAAARGTFVIMGDADDSYDFSHIPRFLEKLREGDDLVMGNRFMGGIEPGAMPALHRYLGNPVLSGLGRMLFGSPCHDFHCGLRGFRRDAIQNLNLRTPGMEFASEMVVKATLHGLRISEVPTTLSPDGRSRPPHLRSFRDGWRHLRFMLLFSPSWLFLRYEPKCDIDVAFCNGVFHHIAPVERTTALRHVFRALRPGGVFALWENNPWNPGTRHSMRVNPFDRDAVAVSARDARRLLLGTGFEVAETTYAFYFPRMLRGLRWLEPGLSRLPLGAQYLVLAVKPILPR